MKRLLALTFSCALSCVALHAQAVDTTVCDILKDPQSFNGKTVRIKGTVVADFDQFAIKGAAGCGHTINCIWLSYPEGTKAKSGPAAVLQLQAAHNFAGTVKVSERAPVQLDKSKDFKQFESLLTASRRGSGMCLGCTRNQVSATFVGRLDGVEQAGVKRDAAGKIVAIDGFGNLNQYPARLVLASVSDVSAQEIDFSKIDPITQSEVTADTASGDPVAQAHKFATAFGPGNPLGAQIEKAAAAFGKAGEDNGVNIGFGAADETSPKAEAQSTKDSPDGVLYNCTFNMNRLPGSSLSRAIVHIGQHIVDLRNPPQGADQPGPFELEYQAGLATVLSAVANGQKTLTLPGGYMIWNASWSPADREKLAGDNLKSYVSVEESFGR